MNNKGIDTTYKINMETMTPEATHALYQLDDTFVGTKHYMGLTYFWHGDYKFVLREVSVAKRRKVHHALLKAGLNISEKSTQHARIIADTLKISITNLME